MTSWLDEIEDSYWKDHLQKILNKVHPLDKERLFLVSFLYDKLKWTPIDIFTFLDLYNNWADYNYDICKRQVIRICERKKNGFLNYCCEKETQQHTTPQCGAAPPFTNGGVCVGFRFFNERKKGGELDMANVEIVKKFMKIVTKQKYYQLVEKAWDKGNGEPIHFLSLESGRVLESEEGVKFYDKPEKFLTLPLKKELINELGEAFVNYPNANVPDKIETKKK